MRAAFGVMAMAWAAGAAMALCYAAALTTRYSIVVGMAPAQVLARTEAAMERTLFTAIAFAAVGGILVVAAAILVRSSYATRPT